MTALKKLSSLKGRRALITGATGHLGLTFADTLAELGADLILVDRILDDLKIASAKLEELWGVNVDYQVCDLEQQDQRQNLIEFCNRELDNLNILVNNAAFVGTSDLDGWAVPFKSQTQETWRRAFEVNLTAVFHLCQGLAPKIKSGSGASIINIASIYGVYGPDWFLYENTKMGNPAAYGASKGALIQFTRWLSATLAPHIRVNAISPGGIFRGQPDIFVERYKAKVPMGRMATEDDFRGILAYLASDLSIYVTGQNFIIDGGLGCI